MALSNKGRRLPLLLSVAGLAAIGGSALAQGLTPFARQSEAGRDLHEESQP